MFGFVSVSVGYLYAGCSETLWDVSEVKISGYKLSISDIGGWNLDIHHHFDVLNGTTRRASLRNHLNA